MSKQIERIVESARFAFDAIETAMVEQIQTSILNPFLKKKQYRFYTGNGDWYFRNKKGKYLEDDQLPVYIKNILWTKSPRNHWVVLGELFRDYDGRDE